MLNKTRIFRFGLAYDAIVISYIGCFYLFWYVWKEESHSNTMVVIRSILLVIF